MSALGKWNWYNPLPFFKRSEKLYEKDAKKKELTLVDFFLFLWRESIRNMHKPKKKP
jgi:hypothetical protein